MAEVQERSQDSSPIFNITKEGFQELTKVKLTLDQLFYLECCRWRVSLKDVVPADKYLSWKQSLIRKGYVDELGNPTADGLEALKAVKSGEPFKGALERAAEDTLQGFDKWWNTFPPSDVFEIQGKRFEGSRTLRIRKNDCRDAFVKIMEEKTYSVDDLIGALQYEVQAKKQMSLKERDNKLRYMHNSLTYLKQRDFEGFMNTPKKTTIVESNEDI